MDENKETSFDCFCVPFAVHESEMARSERTVKRLVYVIVLLTVLLFGSNAAWLYYESQFETVETWEVIQENDGGLNNYIGNDGDIINGKTNGTKN